MVKANIVVVAKKVGTKIQVPPAGKQLLTFLEEVKLEMGKVVWPSRTETTRMSLIVIGVSLAVGAFLGGLDFMLTQLTDKFILK